MRSALIVLLLSVSVLGAMADEMQPCWVLLSDQGDTLTPYDNIGVRYRIWQWKSWDWTIFWPPYAPLAWAGAYYGMCLECGTPISGHWVAFENHCPNNNICWTTYVVEYVIGGEGGPDWDWKRIYKTRIILMCNDGANCSSHCSGVFVETVHKISEE